MIRIKQLQKATTSLVEAYNKCFAHFNDPLYLAYIIDFIFDSKPPPPTFSILLEARRSKVFREFWEAYKATKAAISNFQMVNMGVITESERRNYMKKFRREYPEEVPF